MGNLRRAARSSGGQGSQEEPPCTVGPQSAACSAGGRGDAPLAQQARVAAGCPLSTWSSDRTSTWCSTGSWGGTLQMGHERHGGIW